LEAEFNGHRERNGLWFDDIDRPHLVLSTVLAEKLKGEIDAILDTAKLLGAAFSPSA
jgi:hypothetical protein